MKKIFSCLILIMCSLMCLACGDPSISYAQESITINITDTYTISDDDIKISGTKSDYEIVILDPTIATIKDMVITPLKRGNTKVRFQLKDDSDYFCEVPLSITYNIYATSARVENDYVQINMHINRYAYNEIDLNDGCNEIPTITYDSSIIDYNYLTGAITAKKEGSTTVVVLFGACNVSFNVNVVNVVYTTQIEVSDNKVFEGSKGKFSFFVFPDTSNTYEFYTISNKITVNKDGSYDAKYSGVAEVHVKYLTSNDAEYTYKTFNVIIQQIPDDFDASVTAVSGENPAYYLMENMYRISISRIYEITGENLTFSNNVDVENIIVEEEGIFVDFYFLEKGRLYIDITISLDEYTHLEKSLVVEVNNFEDIEVYAKWFMYEQTIYADGKYRVYLNGGNNLANYLRFSLIVGEYTITEKFKVYNITNGSRELYYDSTNSGNSYYTFEPSETGEYVFEFVIGDEVVEIITILVLNKP